MKEEKNTSKSLMEKCISFYCVSSIYIALANEYIYTSKEEGNNRTNKLSNSQESISLLVCLLQEDSRVSAAKGRADDFFRDDDPTNYAIVNFSSYMLFHLWQKYLGFIIGD